MADSWMELTYQAMRSRATPELLRIWQRNDREVWADHAFEAIRRVLAERGVALPPQESFLLEPADPRPGDFVVVAAFSSETEAGVVQAALTAAGILCLLLDKTVNRWALPAPGGEFQVEVLVREGEVTRAAQLLGLAPAPATELEAACAPEGRGTEPEAASAPGGRGTELAAASEPGGKGTELEAGHPVR